MRSIVTLLFLALPLCAQDPKGPPPGRPKVDQARVDAAIRKGIEFLRTHQASVGAHRIGGRAFPYDELVLWTFIHAGVPESDPMFQLLQKAMLEKTLEATYNVSLQAMILEAMDRVKFQPRLQQCAQFLVDNQCKDGEWTYGQPTLFAEGTPTVAGRPDVASGKGTKPKEADPLLPVTQREKPKVVRHVTVKKMREGPASGDHSNSQYAALGLRACHDAGVHAAPEVIRLAQRAWRDLQHREEARTPGGDGGWCYAADDDSCTPYGSMTAGGTGSVAIYDYILGEDWRKDRSVLRGLDWMARNFTVTDNPGRPDRKFYYYLYSLERMGMLYGTETVGRHDWYPEGVDFLLTAQGPDGSWAAKTQVNPLRDTCFAILFLRRATRPLQDVPSVDRTQKR